MGPDVPEMKNFKCFFTIYGHGGHLDHVTRIIYKHIDSPFPKMLPIKVDFGWQSGFREDL